MSESIAKRYFSKIIGNIGSGVLVLGAQALMVRLLGPAVYGQFAFIQSHFEYLVTDLGLSNVFFTRISQDKENYRRVGALFLLVLLSMAGALTIYILVVAASGQRTKMWPEIPLKIVWLGFALAVTTFLGRMAVLITDASGYAKWVEVARLGRATLGIVLIALLCWVGRLSLATAMSALVAGQLFFLLFTVPFGHRKFGGMKLDFERTQLKNLAIELWPMAAPIIGYSLFTIFPILFDRWFLQRAFGSVEQSYFGMGMQVATALFLATCALTAIFHREAALLFQRQDVPGLLALFQTYTRRIFSAAAVPGIFVCLNAKDISLVLGGKNLVPAASVIAVLALYPIIQGAGQLSVAFQYATNRTKLYTIVGIVRDSVGIPISLFLVGGLGTGLPSLNLGAFGLAIKFLIAVCITTYSMHFSNCRYLRISFWRHLGKEVMILLCLFPAAWAGQWFASQVSVGGMSTIIISGTTYVFLSAGFVLLKPQVFGFTTDGLVMNYFLRKMLLR